MESGNIPNTSPVKPAETLKPPTLQLPVTSPTTSDVVEEEIHRDGVVVELLKNGRSRLKGGTIDGIIRWLLETQYGGDVRVLRAFLLCYRLFVQPKELWDKVIAYFPFDRLPEDKKEEEEQRQQLRETVITFVLNWIEECSIDDFFSIEGKFAPPLWKSTQELLKKLQIGKFKEFTASLIEKIQAVTVGVKQREKEEKVEAEAELSRDEDDADSAGLLWNFTSGMVGLYSYYLTSSEPRPPLVEGQFGLLDLQPEEICTCLTLADFHQFRRIRLNEFLLRSWEKEKKTSKIADITQRFERIAYWVATEMCSTLDLYRRKALLEHFIFTAQKCHACNNFHTTMAILAGLTNGAVARLKNTWKELPYATRQLYDQLEHYYSPTQNFRTYREGLERVKTSGKSAFPYLAVYLRDITFAHENPNTLQGFGDGVYNFQKLEIMGRQIIEIKHFQQTPFQLTEVEEVIHTFFRDLKIVTREDEMYRLSNIAEPREVQAAP